MTYQPSRDEEIEAVREPRRLLAEWFEAYNDVDVEHTRSLCHFPLVSFGGGRLSRTNLDFSLREDGADFVPNTRDEGWSYSLVDRWAVHQHSPAKSHIVADFRRFRSDGSAYGVGLSRLAICTKRDGEWGVQLLSSCGMRNPARVEDRSDSEIIGKAKATVLDLFEAYDDGDAGRLRDLHNFPNVRVDGVQMEIAERPDDLQIEWPGDDVEPAIVSMEVLPPQSGDKVVVDVNVGRETDAGTVREAGAVYLVTEQDGTWGVQMKSVPDGDDLTP